MKEKMADLFSQKRVNALRAQIRSDRAADRIASVPINAGTEYVAAADGEGNLVSFIQSNFMSFGSGVVEPETAIVLQNRGHLFSLQEDHPNCIGPHKRCVYTLMPGLIMREEKPYAALGLKGGHVQPQGQVQMITNLVDFGMTIQEAISAPRFNHLSGSEVAFEPGISPSVIDGLARRGHKVVSAAPESFGGAHAIIIDPETAAFVGGSDPRKGGGALGF
jgi:gamma-glutamyltranspeptidase / glutathione hydrolase